MVELETWSLEISMLLLNSIVSEMLKTPLKNLMAMNWKAKD